LTAATTLWGFRSLLPQSHRDTEEPKNVFAFVDICVFMCSFIFMFFLCVSVTLWCKLLTPGTDSHSPFILSHSFQRDLDVAFAFKAREFLSPLDQQDTVLRN